MTRSAKATKALRSRACAKLYPEDTILKRLPQALEDLEALGASIQEEHAVVRQRHLARHGDVPTADLPHIRDCLRRRATRAGRDHRRAGGDAPGDAVDAGGLEGFRQGHRRQDGGQLPRQRPSARSWSASQEHSVRASAAPFLCSSKAMQCGLQPAARGGSRGADGRLHAPVIDVRRGPGGCGRATSAPRVTADAVDQRFNKDQIRRGESPGLRRTFGAAPLDVESSRHRPQRCLAALLGPSAPAEAGTLRPSARERMGAMLVWRGRNILGGRGVKGLSP
jgi:hypothetical protein